MSKIIKKSATIKAKSKMDNYSFFLSSLDPIIIALVREAFTVDRERYLESEKEELNAKIESTLVKLSKDAFDVQSTIYLTVTRAGEDESLIDFVAEYYLHFHGQDVSEINVNRFVSSEIRIVVWPYFRELVNNATGRMHIPPIILPVSSSGERLKSS